MKNLILIGGNLKKDSPILKKIAENYKGGEVLIIPYASSVPFDTYFHYAEIFKKYGIKNLISFLAPSERDRLNVKKLERHIEKAEIIFFTGGNQLKLTTMLGGTKIFDVLKNLKKRDVMIIGTSAGAAFMGDLMIYEGSADKGAFKGKVELTKGLGLLKDIVIDTHFHRRRRLLRLIQVVVSNPSVLGIGLSEDTAIFVKGDFFEVVGRGVVTVIDGRDIKKTNISGLRPGRPFGVENVKIHILSPEGEYDLKNRKVIKV